jgi:hypothetical protein
VQEDSPTYGEARLGGVTLHVEPRTRMQVTLPRDYVTSWGENDRVPFVLDIGSPGVALHMNRPELERLHALIGRALERTRGRDRPHLPRLPAGRRRPRRARRRLPLALPWSSPRPPHHARLIRAHLCPSPSRGGRSPQPQQPE